MSRSQVAMLYHTVKDHLKRHCPILSSRSSGSIWDYIPKPRLPAKMHSSSIIADATSTMGGENVYPVAADPPMPICQVCQQPIEANDRLGLTPYVIDAVSPIMTAQLLPVVVFITVSLLSFTTGSNWGVIAITMPIAFPLAQTFEVSIPLVMGALFSASGFGSHACFYSDSTVLSAQGAGCRTHEHATTQLPYALLGAAVAAILFVVMA